MRSAPAEFAALALLSIPLWLVFEWFNRSLRNWHYIGLPDNPALRYFGYAWAFATIWPAIFEAAELIAVVRAGWAGWAGRAGKAGWAGWAGRAGREGRAEHPGQAIRPAHPACPAYPALSIAAGALMLASPLLLPRYANDLAAPVWLGFIFLLDPINARLGGESLERDLRAGHRDRLINLLLGGFLCGVLWEFWNYWARTKWIYTVPTLRHRQDFRDAGVRLFRVPRLRARVL